MKRFPNHFEYNGALYSILSEYIHDDFSGLFHVKQGEKELVLLFSSHLEEGWKTVIGGDKSKSCYRFYSTYFDEILNTIT